MSARGCGGIMGVVFSIIWLALSSVNGYAQTNSISHSPAQVVEKYFALDNKGVRLDADSFESVAHLVDWKEEPVWGKVIVISGFTVPDDFRKWEIVNRLEVLVPVEFQVLGVMYMDSAGFVPEPGTEQVRVRVKVQGAQVENHGADFAAPRGTEALDELRATGAARRKGRGAAGIPGGLAG